MSGFSVQKGCVAARLLLLCSPQWPVLGACPRGGGKRLQHTQPCGHIRGRGVNPALTTPQARLSEDVLVFRAGKKGSLVFAAARNITWSRQRVWHLTQLFMASLARGTNGPWGPETTNVLVDTVVIRSPLNRKLCRVLPSRGEDRDVSHFCIYSI